MSGGGLGLLMLAGLAALAAGSRSRSTRDFRADAQRALDATDAEARDAGFVQTARNTPRGRVILPTEADVERVSGTTTPARLDPRLARALAGPLARALRRDQPSPLERRDVARFQAAAGLVPSGLYDDATREQLARFGIRNAPPAWFQQQ